MKKQKTKMVYLLAVHFNGKNRLPNIIWKQLGVNPIFQFRDIKNRTAFIWCLKQWNKTWDAGIDWAISKIKL